MKMTDSIERPACCGECMKYIRDEDEPGCGYCDNWGGVRLHDGDVCSPNFGVKVVKREVGHEQFYDASVRRWFQSRGIVPTLAEYREVAACLRNGSNPVGIH